MRCVQLVPQLALKALDIDLPLVAPLFEKDTILDLVVAHECMDFMSKCCSEAITIQVYGDMKVIQGARGEEALKEKRRQEQTCSRLPASFSLTRFSLEAQDLCPLCADQRSLWHMRTGLFSDCWSVCVCVSLSLSFALSL